VDLDRLGSCRSSGPMDLNAQPGDEEDPWLGSQQSLVLPAGVE
jgi:hypothetical protein